MDEGPDGSIFLYLASNQVNKWHEILLDIGKVFLPKNFLYVLLAISCHLFGDSP